MVSAEGPVTGAHTRGTPILGEGRNAVSFHGLL